MEETKAVLTCPNSEYQHLAPQALENLLTGLEARQKCIADEIQNAFAKIVNKVL